MLPDCPVRRRTRFFHLAPTTKQRKIQSHANRLRLERVKHSPVPFELSAIPFPFVSRNASRPAPSWELF